jgi:type II secretory pathway pseudopilin PulG
MNVLRRQLRPPGWRAFERGAACGARRARGFSLVEAMVSAGIVGVMLVASVNLLSSAARTRVADNGHRTGLLLAQQLITEVQTQPYKDESILALLFGPELGETSRLTFDDIDDYNDYREKPPKDHNGAAMVGYEGWERRVRVHWVSPDTLRDAASDTGLVLIDVKVIDPRGMETHMYALRAERAVPADPPLSGSTWVQWTDIELEVGGQTPRRTATGVAPVMRPPVK